MISINKRFLFIHITKTAGTAIEETIEDDSCICKRNQIDDRERGYLAPLNHLTLREIIRGDFVPDQELEKFFKFAFVRNPWDRVISECFCPHIQLIFLDCQDIAERIKTVCLFAEEGVGGHCLRQTEFIKPGIFSLDFIGRYENLEDNMEYVLKKIGLPDRTFTVRNKTERKHYREFYNTETRKLVEKTYEEEIEKFGYLF